MENKDVPYVVHESDMARMERSNKRLWVALLVAVCIIAGMFIYEAQFETVSVDAEQDGYGVNIVSGGNADYGPES